ncbi:MAG: proline--tRNA ligase, partial [Oscillospiraceae bacterium]|nr:proline--tRNA ligase [Oscillospiraceae bacterium]
FIPESLLQKEKDHVEGFAPEVAWVTHGGSEKLAEKLCVRPTSEVLFCEHYANIIQSHRDLPKLYNQWCTVVRWEKTTRPFLRSLEFQWQEGHTAHKTAEEAREFTIEMLEVYAKFCEEFLAIPVVKGLKTEREKFAGAVETYTIEALMHDGKALQSGTTHYFGDGFAKAFDIQFSDENNQLKHIHQTSWGVSTRLIGAMIMVHSDDNGLVLPPTIAPTQVMIVPIAQHKEGVLEKANEIKERLSNSSLLTSNLRIACDASDKAPGWKFAQHEMQGIPLRLEIGPKDIENNQCVLVRRDTHEKMIVSLNEIETKVPEILAQIQSDMLARARENLEANTQTAKTFDEFKTINKGFIKAMWCGDEACELKIKEETTATSRCIPADGEQISATCIVCPKPAKHVVYWGKAY